MLCGCSRTLGRGSRVLNLADQKSDKKFPKCIEGGGTPNKENFLRKRWFFWALPWTKSQEKLSTDRLVLLALFVSLASWCDSQEMEIFSELSYLTSISLKCKLCPMQSYDPWQVLTFATSAKVPPDQFLLIHSQVYLCLYLCTQPQNILSDWFGEEKVFWRVHRAEKPRQRIQRVLGKTCTNVPCLPGLGNPSWDQNAHRNERTTFHTSNQST